MNISRATAEELTELLEELLEYMEPRMDAELLADGTISTNQEMKFARRIQEPLRYLKFELDTSE